MLLLLARLGLRPSDICKLKLADLEWWNGTILVSGKNRRETRLPLAQEVGDAIIYYLKNWRPDVLDEHVFINCSSPRISVTRNVVSKAVIRAINRTGVKAPIYGAYLLRHSAATNMLNEGLSLSSIGSIMRHSSLDTTRVYANVDLTLLNEIIMPWSEVEPC
jgi:integrase/recombinase XerD